MKDINEKMLEILDEIEFEEVPLSEIELARIKKIQTEKIEKEKSKLKRAKRKRIYTGIAACFVIALGIAFFMRGGQDGESNIATEDEGGTVRITEIEEEKPRDNIHEKDYEFQDIEKDKPSKDGEVEEEKEGEKIEEEKKDETIDDIRVAEKDDNKKEDNPKEDKEDNQKEDKQEDKKDFENNPNQGVGTAGEGSGNINNNQVEITTNLTQALERVGFNAMVPRITGVSIDEILTTSNSITVLYSYNGKVITFKTSQKEISSHVKKTETVNIGGINMKMGKTALGEEYSFKKSGAYFNISIIGDLEKTFLEKFIKSIK